MSVHLRATSAVLARPRSPLRRCLTALAFAALTAACAQARPTPVAGPDPADPSARVGATSYRSTIAPYESARPVEPAPWREQNERIAPQPRP